MPKENKWNLVAPCGLYCQECSAFLNGKCGGCRSGRGLSKKYRKYCQIYECLNNKKIKICLGCKAFPCKFFDFFKAERLEESSWFLDIWSNMKQIKEKGLINFLKNKANWLKEREECAKKNGVKSCHECKRWPCEFLKRPVLGPVNFEAFKKFMKKHKN